MLLENNADVNLPNFHGQTPLHLVCLEAGNAALLELLLSFRPIVNALDDEVRSCAMCNGWSDMYVRGVYVCVITCAFLCLSTFTH